MNFFSCFFSVVLNSIIHLANKRSNGFDRWGVSYIGLWELNYSFVLSLNVNLIRLESNKSN